MFCKRWPLAFFSQEMFELIDPSPASSQQYASCEDCPFQLLLVASDIRPALHQLNHEWVFNQQYPSPSRYKIEGSDFLPALLPGCIFSLKSYSHGNSIRLFTWMRRTDQQGKKVELCFGVRFFLNYFAKLLRLNLVRSGWARAGTRNRPQPRSAGAGGPGRGMALAVATAPA